MSNDAADGVRSLAHTTRTASANGTGVDMKGASDECFNEAVVVIHGGTITDGTHTFEVQESDDDATYSAIADTRIVGTEPALGAADDDEVHVLIAKPTKRYVRVAVTVAGATTGGAYGAVIVRTDPRRG